MNTKCKNTNEFHFYIKISKIYEIFSDRFVIFKVPYCGRQVLQNPLIEDEKIKKDISIELIIKNGFIIFFNVCHDDCLHINNPFVDNDNIQFVKPKKYGDEDNNKENKNNTNFDAKEITNQSMELNIANTVNIEHHELDFKYMGKYDEDIEYRDPNKNHIFDLDNNILKNKEDEIQSEKINQHKSDFVPTNNKK